MTPKQLKEVRLVIGLTQTDMARRLNTPRSTYVKWERGESVMPGIVDIAVKYITEDNRC